MKWKFETSDNISYSSPAIGNDGTVYIASNLVILNDYGHFYYLYAINPDGSEKWRFLPNYRLTSTPAIGNDGTIYIGSEHGYLYAINPDGSEKWRILPNGRFSYSSPAISNDGTVYIGSRDGYLYAIYTMSKGLANSSWPRFQHNNKNSGNYNK
ncbi:hypothetical protein JCM30566_05580 [Marinitoga arctica]